MSGTRTAIAPGSTCGSPQGARAPNTSPPDRVVSRGPVDLLGGEGGGALRPAGTKIARARRNLAFKSFSDFEGKEV